MKRDDVDKFEKLAGQFQSSYEELSLLSRKSPTDAVNVFKLRFINSLIRDSNKFLGPKYKPFKEFSEFNEDDLPQNSDVIFVLSQYLQCFEKYRADNTRIFADGWRWVVETGERDEDGNEVVIHIRTVTPKRLREK
jgi:hypothetical protein